MGLACESAAARQEARQFSLSASTMPRYLPNWIDQLRWQRLEPFRKLALMLLDHLEGILNYCRRKAPLPDDEASVEVRARYPLRQ